ncbi:MAG: hypothetical protein CSA74_08170 [Rhodobacterales bacterium]|nr:MAG: hypothetical protein CSA74_08170 [Rhodobacterales bacterium]
MLHFRSPAVENHLPPARDPNAGSGTGTIAASQFAVSGIGPSSVVETARGPVLARDLRLGDKLVTRDKGLQPLRWIGESAVAYGSPAEETAAPRRGPVRIRAGAAGSNPDAGNLVLAPGQRLLVRGRLNELLFATDEVMAAAGDLTHLDGIDIVPRDTGRWVHLLLDSHELLRVNGLWMESFAPDMWSLRVAWPEHWHQITEAMPRLKYDAATASYVGARLSLDAREARLVEGL